VFQKPQPEFEGFVQYNLLVIPPPFINLECEWNVLVPENLSNTESKRPKDLENCGIY